MLYAMSDFHGNSYAFHRRKEQLEPYLKQENSKVLLLGDFIDNGMHSYECLKLAKDMQDTYGKDKVIATKGNHEVWFLDFLADVGDEWLDKDRGFRTCRTFLSREEYDTFLMLQSRDERLVFIKNAIRTSHKELLDWMKELPLYYETPTQIFTHAGVDEDIPAEAIDYCTLSTPEYFFTGKYPPTRGWFPKDIIAGHVAASHIARNPRHRGVYFDGCSHYCIDGSVNKTRYLICLAYDEEAKQYYELTEDGSLKPVQGSGNRRETRLREY